MQVLPNWRWAVELALPCVPALLLLRSDSKFFYYPVSLLLIGSAITAFAALTVCAVVMARNHDNHYGRFGQIAPLVSIGIVVAIALLLVLAGGRFWLESALHLPSPA